MRRAVHLLVLCVAALPACSAGATTIPASDAQVVVGAPARTSESGSARISVTNTVDVPGRAAEVQVAEGAYDFERRIGELGFDVPAAAGDRAGEPTHLVTIVTPTTIYCSGIPGTETPWLSIDLRLVAAGQGADLARLQGAGGDPVSGLSAMTAIGDDVVEVGDEEVRGVPATRYRGTIDLRAAYESAGAVQDRERFEGLLDELGTDVVEAEAWIDQDGRVVRQSTVATLPGTEIRSTTVVELFDFGVEVDITVPPADQVTDLSALALEAFGDGG